MRKFLKNKILSLSIFTLLLLFMAIGIDIAFKRNNNPERIAKKFEKKLHKKELQVLSVLDNISERIGDTSQNQNILTNCYGLFQKDGIIILLYDHDTLMEWSDNFAPVNAVYDSMVGNRSFGQLQNGMYRIVEKDRGAKKLVGLILLKSEFNYQNNYLVNSFQRDFKTDRDIEIEDEPGKYDIFGLDNRFVFSLHFDGKISIDEKQVMILFVLYLAALLFFTSLMLQVYLRFLNMLKSRLLLISAFIIDIVIVRGLLFYFKIPGSLYQSDLFGPAYYGSSVLLPSLGDLIVNAFLVLFIAYAVYIVVKPDKKSAKRPMPIKYLLSFLLFVLSYLMFYGMIFIWESLVIDSNISLNLNNVFGLSTPSFLGFIVIATLVLAYFLITNKIHQIILAYCPSIRGYIILLILSLAFYSLGCYFFSNKCEIAYIIFLAIYTISFWYIGTKNISDTSFYKVVFYLILFSIISTYSLHRYNIEKEIEERKLLAVKLSAERDKLAEYMFVDVAEKMLADSTMAGRLDNALFDEVEELNVTEYIIQNYLGFYRSKYNFQITLCDSQRNLEIQPENYIIRCKDFFSDLIFQTGESTAAPNLYFLNDGSEDINYIGVIRFPGDTSGFLGEIDLYIELYSKYVPRALGYPELLIDKKASDISDVSNYSYAIYVDGELLKRVGSYVYNINENDIESPDEEFVFYKKDRHNHLLYRIDESTHLYISQTEPSFSDIVAPFSYLIIFFGLYLLIFLFVSFFPFHIYKIEVNFKSRIQIAIIAIILISFLVIGITSSFYIVELNDNKNLDILSEKAHSVLIEVEHKLADVPTLEPGMREYLDGLLTKFSQVFFSDINLFDLNGQVIASSRPEIFEEGLISTLMDARAFEEMAHYDKTLFIHQEQIGNYEYLSAYVPFRNEENRLIAYLNLPYFAKQTELRSQLSTFLIAFTNIYIILIAIAIFVALVISNYITLPLQIIREKISKLKLGKPNEKINWVRKDEIGNLIIEYNRMIDELSSSAEMLAQSERESAWREMAKQVAHEIKNPLTPMKLSIQYLQKAWEENAPDWEQRLKRFSQTLIQQIDNLSAIASEFSDFAKMPQSKMEKIDLAGVIMSAIEFFKEVDKIHFKSNARQTAPCYVNADKKQMLRVFNNLIKNSIQAIRDPSQGKIEINIKRENGTYLISVNDNGTGIPKEQAEKIFTPSFTTKSGGMGLGLAIIKSTVLSSGGEIWFESALGKGTTFFIRLPVYKPEEIA